MALHLTKPAEPGVACEVSFEVLPGFEHFSQEMLNRQTDNPDWEAFYREGLSDFYQIASVERFDHAGVRGAVVSAISKPKPMIRNWAADQPTLIFMFYTPKGLSKIACLNRSSRRAASNSRQWRAAPRCRSEVRSTVAPSGSHARPAVRCDPEWLCHLDDLPHHLDIGMGRRGIAGGVMWTRRSRELRR